MVTAARIERPGLFDRIAGARASVADGVKSADASLAGSLELAAEKDDALVCRWKGDSSLAATFTEATKVFHVWQGRNRMAIDAVGLDVDGKLGEALVVARDEGGNVLQKGPRGPGRVVLGADAAAHPEVGEALALFRDGKLVRLAPVIYKDPRAQVIATLETNEVPAEWLTCKPTFGWYSLFRPRHGLKTFHATHAAGQPSHSTLVLAAASRGAYAPPAGDVKCYTCGKSSRIAVKPAGQPPRQIEVLDRGDGPGAAATLGDDHPLASASSAGSAGGANLLSAPAAAPSPSQRALATILKLGAKQPSVTKGALLARWEGTWANDDVTALDPIGAFGLGLPFSTLGRAVAWGSVITVATNDSGQSLDGSAIIENDGAFFVWQVSVGGITSFSRSNVESLTQLKTDGSPVRGVRCFITNDGYVAPVTRSPSPSPDVPVYIVDRKRRGRYWHSTRFPSDAEMRQLWSDVQAAGGRIGNAVHALAFFRAFLRARALGRLDENRAITFSEEQKYADTSAGNADWARLRTIIRQDRAAAAEQRDAEAKVSAANLRKASAYPPGGAAAPFNYGGIYQAEVDEAASALALVKMVRATMRREYPALAALDTSKIADTDTNGSVLAMMAAGMVDARNAIEEAYRRVHEDDIPVHKLGPLVEEVCAELGIDDAKRAAGDVLSKAALDWLASKDRTEAIIRWAGTIFTVALGIGALVATGGTAALLGLAGAATGVGTAAYELGDASAMYAAAKAGQVGQPMVSDPEAARFSYIMAWVNLVLAGVDLGLAAHAAAPVVKGAMAARRVATTTGAEILARIAYQDVAKLELVVRLRAAGKAAEAEEILAGLRKTIGAETVDKAVALFTRRAALDELLAALTNELGAEATQKLAAALGEDVLGEIGKDGMKALVAEHGVEGVIALKDKLGPALFRALAAPQGKVPGLSPKLLGELAEKVSRELLEKVGPDALRAFAGALPKGDDYVRVIGRLGHDVARRIGVGLGRDLIADLGDKAVLQLVEDLDRAAWTRVAEGIEALATKGDEGACKLLAREVEGVQGAGAHSLGRHGPEVSDQALGRRVTQGIAPDNAWNPYKAASRFKSYKDWLKTRQEAINGSKTAMGVDVTKPPAPGGKTRVRLIVQHKQPIDEGCLGTGTTRMVHDATPGSTKSKMLHPSTTPVSGVTRTQTAFEWNQAANGGRGAWEMKQHFPVVVGWDEATKTYTAAATAVDYVVP